MANYCDIEEVKMTSNPVYEVADMKPQSITTHKNDKSILNFLWWQRKKKFYICSILLLLSLLVAVLAVLCPPQDNKYIPPVLM